jgi:hypothetical protein
MKNALAVLLFFSIAFAHLESGVDRQVGPYLLDVGWEPAAPAAGEPVFFAVNVVDYETQERTDFDSAWVRFSKGDRIAYAGSLAMDRGSTSFSYEFPEAGVWEMDVRFGNYSDKVDVFVPGESAGADNLIWLAGGAVLGGAVVFILRMKKS